jgi:predicted nucleic acid-binding protein
LNVVDSSGWLEYLSGGSATTFFAAAIEDSESLIVPTVSIYEVFKRIVQLHGERVALDKIGVMRRGTSVDLTDAFALSAARISLHHKLPMADSIIYATARAFDATLWTQDADFKGLPGIRYRQASSRS